MKTKKKKKTIKLQRIIIDDASSQDVESNQSPEQITFRKEFLFLQNSHISENSS